MEETRLEEESSHQSTDQDPDSSKQQEQSYAAFTEGIYDALVKTDRFAQFHDIRLGAQDDD